MGLSQEKFYVELFKNDFGILFPWNILRHESVKFLF